MGREVPLALPIARTGVTWASDLRHTSSGALLQGQAPAVRMDYKQDARASGDAKATIAAVPIRRYSGGLVKNNSKSQKVRLLSSALFLFNILS